MPDRHSRREDIGTRMTRWSDFLSVIGVDRVLLILGGLYVTVAIVQAGRVSVVGGPTGELLVEFVLLAIPGIALLYGGYWLPRTSLHPDTFPRVAGWSLGGFGLMLGIVVLLILNPGGGVDRPLRAVLLATALGCVGGMGVGLNEARALSRARDAEQHREELRKERDLRERIFETSPTGIVVVDADQTISFVNEVAAELLEFPQAEISDIEALLSRVEITSPDGTAIAGELYQRVLSTGDSISDVERLIIQSDGQQSWLSVHAAPLHDPGGKVTAVVFTLEDITERKERERALEESHERLEEFASAVSHDLREPLGTVATYLQLLERRYEENLDEDAKEFIDFAVDGATRMQEMIDGLVTTYARVDTEGEPFEPVDLDTVVEDVLVDLEPKIHATNADITAEPLPQVAGDRGQVRQVLMNLVDNAIKYAGDAPPRVRIAAEKNGDTCQISVSDDGIGIKPEATHEVFDVFSRLHPEEEYPGTGIGLAICKRIVERHDGDIWVESTPREGSTFYFTLPAAT